MSLTGEDVIENHFKLKEVLPTVMTSGAEKIFNRFKVKEWVDRGAYEMVQPDVSIIGLTESWYTVRMTNLKGYVFCPHK